MAATPVRIQRKRTKGWSGLSETGNDLPITYVNRPLVWGNPFSFPRGNLKAQARAVRCYETALRGGRLPYSVEDVKRELRRHNIGCFCKVGEPCHGDVLLRIANEDDE